MMLQKLLNLTDSFGISEFGGCWCLSRSDVFQISFVFLVKLEKLLPEF